MLAKTNAVHEAWAAAERTLDFKVTVNGTTYTATDITELDFDAGAMNGDALTLGSTYANTVKIVFSHLVEGLALTNEITPEIGIQLPDGTWDYTALGVFVIDSQVEQDRNNNTTTVSATDRFVMMGGTYTSKLDYPADVLDVATEIADQAGVQINATDIGHLPAAQVPSAIAGATLREAIGFVAQFCAGFATFDRDGQLSIRTLNDPEFTITTNQYQSKGLTKNEVMYQVDGLTCEVEARDDAGSSDTVTLQSGNTTGNQIVLTNPVMTQNALDGLYTQLQDTNFYPFSLDWFGDPSVEVGDWIEIVDAAGNKFKTPNLLFTLTFNGSLTATSKADTTVTANSNFSYVNTNNKRIIRDLRARIDAAGHKITDGTEAPENPKLGDIWFAKDGPDTIIRIWTLNPDTGEAYWKDEVSTKTTSDIAAQIDEIMKQLKADEDALADKIAANDAAQTVLNGKLDDNAAAITKVKQDTDSAVADVTAKVKQAADDTAKAVSQASDAAATAANALTVAQAADSTSTDAKQSAAEAIDTANQAQADAKAAQDGAAGAVTDAKSALNSAGDAVKQAQLAIKTGQDAQAQTAQLQVNLDKQNGELSASISKVQIGLGQGGQNLVSHSDQIQWVFFHADANGVNVNSPELIEDGWQRFALRDKGIVKNTEVLPGPDHWVTLRAGVTYSQSVEIRTDAELGDLTQNQFTWFATGPGHQYTQSFLVNTAENTYLFYTSFTPSVDEGVRIGDMRLGGIKYESTGTYFDLRHLMINEGALAKAWVPATSDFTDADSNLQKQVTANSTAVEENAEAIKLKADQNTVDDTAKTVQDNSAALKLTAKQADLTAIQQDVDTISGKVDKNTAELSVQAGQIEAKAEKSSVDTLTGDVSQLKTETTQTAAGLKQKISDTQTQLAGISVGTDNLFADAVTMNGWQWRDPGTYGTGESDDITSFGWPIDETVPEGTRSLHSYVTPGRSKMTTATIVAGQTYEISFLLTCYGGSGNTEISVLYGANLENKVVLTNQLAIKHFQRFSASFVAAESGTFFFGPVTDDYGPVNGSIYYALGVLMRGNVPPSAFVPAKADADATVSNLSTRTSTLEKTSTETVAKLTAVTKTADDATTLVNTVKQTADHNAVTIEQVKSTADAIQTQVNSIVSDVNGTKQTIAAVQAKTDGLEFGGQNYVLNSDFSDGQNNWSSNTSNTDSNAGTVVVFGKSSSKMTGRPQVHLYGTPDGAFEGFFQTMVVPDFNKGQKFTVSFDVVMDGTPTNALNIGLHWKNSSGDIINQTWHAISPDQMNTSAVTRVKYSDVTNASGSKVKLMFYNGTGAGGVGNWWIDNIKFSFDDSGVYSKSLNDLQTVAASHVLETKIDETTDLIQNASTGLTVRTQNLEGFRQTATNDLTSVKSEQVQLAGRYTSLVTSSENKVQKSWFDDQKTGTWSEAQSFIGGPDTIMRYSISGHEYYLKLTGRDNHEKDVGYFPVTSGEIYYLSGYLGAFGTSHSVSVGLEIVLADGSASWSPAVTLNGLTPMGYVTGHVTIPANAAKARTWIRINGPANADIGYAAMQGLRVSRSPDSTVINQMQNQLLLATTVNGKVTAALSLSNDGGGTALLEGAHVHITGQTTIDNGVIKDAMIANLSATKITAGTLDASKATIINLNADSIVSGSIDTEKVTLKNLSASSIVSGELDASKVTVSNLSASNIIGGTLDANLVTVRDLSASSITSGTLNAGLLNVINLNADSITTGTLSGANLSMNLNTGEVLFTSGAITGTGMNMNLDSGVIDFTQGRFHDDAGTIDLNVDDGYIATSSGDSQMVLSQGKLLLTQKNIFDPYSATPYLEIANNVTGDSLASASIIGRDSVTVCNSANTGSIISMGVETLAGLFAGKATDGWKMTKVGGADRGVIISGGKMSGGALGYYSPSIVVGCDSSGGGKGRDRISIGASYVHIPSTYSRTISGSANVHVSSDGALVRSTSAAKYKTDILRTTSSAIGHKLLGIQTATWIDKADQARYASDPNHYERPSRNFGMIADDLDAAGIPELVTYVDGEIEGINYDRIGPALVPVIRELNDKVNQLEALYNAIKNDKLTA